MIGYIAVAFLIYALLSACGQQITRPKPTDMTPMGISVVIPQSVYKHGLYLTEEVIADAEEIKAILLSWVDMRVQEWINKNRDLGEGYLLNVAKQQVFVLYDHWAFKCTSSDTGLCTGQYSYRSKVVEAVIYAQWKDYYYPRHNAPPHTIMYSDEVILWSGNSVWDTGKWYAGTMYADGMGLKVIIHELDHAIEG